MVATSRHCLHKVYIEITGNCSHNGIFFINIGMHFIFLVYILSLSVLYFIIFYHSQYIYILSVSVYIYIVNHFHPRKISRYNTME